MDYEGQNLYAQPPMQPSDDERKQDSGRTFKGGLLLGLCIGLAAAIITGAVCYINFASDTTSSDELLDKNTVDKISVIERVIDNYYFDYNDRNLTVEDMREGIYRGMVDSLDDRYAAYYSAEELDQELEENKGIYYGIGAYVSLGENDYPFLSGIMEDTPAERAKLRSGDIIVEVDGESTYGMTLDEVVSRIKGDEGTVVHLTIYREGEDDYIGFDVTRGEVQSQTVIHEMLEDDIGYIGIIQFDMVTIEQFEDAYQDLRARDAKGLIIDLRNNPGGLVTSVVSIARQILPEGLIFYEEDSAGKRVEYTCDGENAIDIPLVVLVNEYSASASEILSGSVRDHGIGTLVGTKTYGKGIVQDIKMLSDGSAVRLTVSAYFLPNGDNIQGVGIEPDVEVELDIDAYYEDGTDVQLDKGIEVLKEQMK